MGYLFGGGLEDDVKGAGRAIDDNIIQPVAKTVEAVVSDPKALLAVGLAIAFPGAGAALGAQLGLTGTVAQVVGQTIINTTLNGGDVKSAVISAALPIAGKELTGTISSALASSDITGVVNKIITQGVSQGATAAILGKDPLAAFVMGGASAGAAAITGEIPGFKDLPQAAQKAINSAVIAQATGRDVGGAVSQSLVNSAISWAKGEVVKNNDAVKKAQETYQAETGKALTSGQLDQLIEAHGSGDLAAAVDRLTTTESEAADLWRQTVGTEPTEFDLMELIGLAENDAAGIADDRATTDTDEALDFFKQYYGAEYKPTADELMELMGKPESAAQDTLKEIFQEDTDAAASEFKKTTGRDATEADLQVLMASASGAGTTVADAADQAETTTDEAKQFWRDVYGTEPSQRDINSLIGLDETTAKANLQDMYAENPDRGEVIVPGMDDLKKLMSDIGADSGTQYAGLDNGVVSDAGGGSGAPEIALAPDETIIGTTTRADGSIATMIERVNPNDPTQKFTYEAVYDPEYKDTFYEWGGVEMDADGNVIGDGGTSASSNKPSWDWDTPDDTTVGSSDDGYSDTTEEVQSWQNVGGDSQPQDDVEFDSDWFDSILGKETTNGANVGPPAPGGEATVPTQDDQQSSIDDLLNELAPYEVPPSDSFQGPMGPVTEDTADRQADEFQKYLDSLTAGNTTTPDYGNQDLGIPQGSVDEYNDNTAEMDANGQLPSQWAPGADGTFTYTDDDGSTLTIDGGGNVIGSTDAPAGNLPGETPQPTTPAPVVPKPATPAPAAPKPTAPGTPSTPARPTATSPDLAALLSALGGGGGSAGVQATQTPLADVQLMEEIFGTNLFSKDPGGISVADAAAGKRNFSAGGSIEALLQLLRG